MAEQSELPVSGEGVERPQPGPYVLKAPQRSQAVYRVGGRYYPLRSVGSCHVCQSPHRSSIEQALLQGRSYAAISRSLPEDEKVSKDSIASHVRNEHLPMELIESRALVEQRAQEIGKDVVNHQASLVDGVTLARGLVQRAHDQMVDDSTPVKMSDALRAAEFLHQVGMDEGGAIDQQAMLDAFSRMMMVTQEVVGDEAMHEIGVKMRSDPILLAALSRAQGKAEPGEDVQVLEAG